MLVGSAKSFLVKLEQHFFDNNQFPLFFFCRIKNYFHNIPKHHLLLTLIREKRLQSGRRMAKFNHLVPNRRIFERKLYCTYNYLNQERSSLKTVQPLENDKTIFKNIV